MKKKYINWNVIRLLVSARVSAEKLAKVKETLNGVVGYRVV
jgi:hypothetical protein